MDKKEQKQDFFSYPRIFLLVIAIITIRVFFEWFFFAFPIGMDIFQDYIRFYLENVYYFLIVFLVGSVFISKFINVALRDVMRFVVKMFPLILLPPIIDHFFLGRREGYYYCQIANFTDNFLTLSFLKGDASLGISIEILLALICITGYVYSKTKSLWKGIFSAVCIDFLLVMISTPDLFLGQGRGDYIFDYFLPLYYFFPLLGISSFVLCLYDPKKLKAILKNLRVVRSMTFIITVFLGGIFHYFMFNNINVLNVFLSSVAIGLVWQVSIVINDISDYEIDKISNPSRPLVSGIFSESQYGFLGIILSFFALSFSVVVNKVVFILVVVTLIGAWVYSMPPLRLRKNFSGNILIGVSMVLSFLTGIYAAGNVFIMTKHVVSLSFLIGYFGVVLTLAKDIKDVEADKLHNVQNIFTVFGRDNGKMITSVLIFFTLNVPAVFLLNIFIFLLSGIAVYLYYRFESIQAVYISGVAIILIVLFHLKESMVY